MLFASILWTWLSGGSRVSNTRPGRRPRRLLSVETLEDRSLPAAVGGTLTPVVAAVLVPVASSSGDPVVPQARTDPNQLVSIAMPGVGVDLGQPPLDTRMTLAVADFNSDGEDDVLFGDEWLNRVALHISQKDADLIWGQADGMVDPRAVRVGDLNGDGNLDVVIVNSGRNCVLVALGEGKGQFEPLQAFHTGDGPASVTIADVNNDGIPDLVVANEKANTLTLLLGQGSGDSWTLTPGPVLQVGQGPVHTLVQDLNNDGNVDILVCNRLSQNVYQLNGVGNGEFDDAHPIIYDVGQTVLQVLVGQFDDRPGQDMIVLDSNGLTLFYKPNFINTPKSGNWISDGAMMPVAAVVGDFNGDGIDDLAVANEDNGSVSFLYGSAKGPVLGRQVFLTGMPHPTDLVQSLTSTALYVGGEGVDQAIRLDWWSLPSDNAAGNISPVHFSQINITAAKATIPAQGIGPVHLAADHVPVEPSAQFEPESNPGALRAYTVLQPLTAAKLAFVAIVEIEVPSEQEEASELLLIVQTNPLTNDERNGRVHGSENEMEREGEIAPSPTNGGLFHFLSGDDELLARQLTDARQRLHEDDAPRPLPLATSVLDQFFRAWAPAATTMLTQVLQFPLVCDVRSLPLSRWRVFDQALTVRYEETIPPKMSADANPPTTPPDESRSNDKLPAEERTTTNPWVEWVVVAFWMAGVHLFAGASGPRRRPHD
jgi:hypothetical protein